MNYINSTFLSVAEFPAVLPPSGRTFFQTFSSVWRHLKPPASFHTAVHAASQGGVFALFYIHDHRRPWLTRVPVTDRGETGCPSHSENMDFDRWRPFCCCTQEFITTESEEFYSVIFLRGKTFFSLLTFLFKPFQYSLQISAVSSHPANDGMLHIDRMGANLFTFY